MTERARRISVRTAGSVPLVVTVPPETIVISVRLDAPREVFTRAGQLGYQAAQRTLAERRKRERETRAMQGRADVFALKARCGSWPKVLVAIDDPNSNDVLTLRVRAWAQERAHVARDGGKVGDLTHVDARTLRRWANEQPRYATDADFDDGDLDMTGHLAAR